MKETISKYKQGSEFFIDEQCYVNELSNSENDQEVSIARARVKPGVATRWHKLDGITERYVILEGSGLVEVGTLQQEVNPNDVVIIPSGCKQRILNNTDRDLIFLAICSPRFIPSAYMDLSLQIEF